MADSLEISTLVRCLMINDSQLIAAENAWLSGLADLVTFGSMTIISLFLMWSPSEAVRSRLLRFFSVLLSVCGMLHFVTYWHLGRPFSVGSVWGALSSALLLVVGAGIILFLLRHRPAQRTLQETRQSLVATQEQLLLEQHFLTALVDNMPDSIYFKDRESKFIRCNPTVADVFQVADPTQLIGLSDHDFFCKEEADEYRADEQHIIETGEPIINKEEYELWPDGQHHWVLSTKLPLHDANQNIIGTLGLSRDISALKQAEERLATKVAELQELHREFEQSNQELEQFAYVASHDLQEPLRSVVGFCQLLEMEYKDKFDDNGQMYLQIIVDGGKRMQRLITDLLEYSRIGRRGSPFTTINLREAIDEALALLQAPISESGAVLEISELPEIQADAGQMIRLFQNLIGNAIKYRGDESPIVRIWAEDAEAYWKLLISDNGIGIPEEFSEQVFIIFKRLHTRKEYPGTGIGLAVCRRIVERHGGMLRLVYDRNQSSGSTIEIRLRKNLTRIPLL